MTDLEKLITLLTDVKKELDRIITPKIKPEIEGLEKIQEEISEQWGKLYTELAEKEEELKSVGLADQQLQFKIKVHEKIKEYPELLLDFVNSILGSLGKIPGLDLIAELIKEFIDMTRILYKLFNHNKKST